MSSVFKHRHTHWDILHHKINWCIFSSSLTCLEEKKKADLVLNVWFSCLFFAVVQFKSVSVTKWF